MLLPLGAFSGACTPAPHSQGEFQLVPTSSSSEGALSSSGGQLRSRVMVCQRPAADGASAPSSLNSADHHANQHQQDMCVEEEEVIPTTRLQPLVDHDKQGKRRSLRNSFTATLSNVYRGFKKGSSNDRHRNRGHKSRRRRYLLILSGKQF